MRQLKVKNDDIGGCVNGVDVQRKQLTCNFSKLEAHHICKKETHSVRQTNI